MKTPHYIGHFTRSTIRGVPLYSRVLCIVVVSQHGYFTKLHQYLCLHVVISPKNEYIPLYVFKLQLLEWLVCWIDDIGHNTLIYHAATEREGGYTPRQPSPRLESSTRSVMQHFRRLINPAHLKA